MSNDIEYENRQIIPRWLPLKLSNHFYKKNDYLSHSLNNSEKTNFESLQQEWLRNKSISIAQELIASSKTLNLNDNKIIIEAKKFLKKDKSDFNKHFPLIERSTVERGDECDNVEFNSQKNIAKIRNSLRIEPYDSILWTDLAFFHLLAGNILKAEKCIRTALALNSENSFILRAAARFYVYKDDPEYAVKLINNSQFVTINPLLASAEIAIAEAFNIKSKNKKKAFTLINDKNFSPKMLTELYATLATLEFNNGSRTNGNKLLNQALLIPNENSLAQIAFLKNKFDGSFNTKNFHLSCQFEADSWNSLWKANFGETIQYAKKWFNFQPFSSRPVLLSSYLNLFIFENFKDSIDLINKGLIISPNDNMLLNNKAVALAMSGHEIEASKIIDKIKNDTFDEEYFVILATSGLIEFRKGNIPIGNRFYQKSVYEFTKTQNIPKLARALYYWGNELLRINDFTGRKMLIECYNQAKKANQKDLLFKLEKNKHFDKAWLQ